jgi:hypothetical protein
MSVGHVSRLSRRYLWFGVRGLSILVLVLGFLLAWIFHLAQIQREAVAAIENDRGTVLYDWEWDNGRSVPGGQLRAPRWLVARIGVDFFGDVTVVKSRSPRLALFGRLTGLQALHVNSGRFIGPQPLNVMWSGFDHQLDHLSGLTKLSELELRGMPVRDAEIVYLKGLTNLSTLRLAGTRLSDNGLPLLKGLANLSTLDLSATLVSDRGLVYLLGLTKLSTLDLSYTRVSDAGLRTVKGMANLSTLHLSSTQVSDARLAYLEG